MRTITSDSEVRSRSPLNLDALRAWYVEKDDEQNISVYFPSFSIYAYEDKFFELLSNCVRSPAISRWSQRPDYTSFDTYGTVMFWPLILYINQIDHIEEYRDKDYIYIPSYSTIVDLATVRPDTNPLLVDSDETVIPNYYKLASSLDTDAKNRTAGQKAIDEFYSSPFE
jgi:hypothetical protein